MSFENILKGRIAETIVEEMFRRVGFTVFPFGMEKILNILTNKPFKLPFKPRVYDYEIDDEDYLIAPFVTEEKIRNLPDFIIAKPSQGVTDLYFIEVKFRRSGSFETTSLWNYYNQGTYIVLVIPKEPYFVCGLVCPPKNRRKIKKLLEEKDMPPPDTFIDLDNYFPEFENFDFKPYIELVEKYLPDTE